MCVCACVCVCRSGFCFQVAPPPNKTETIGENLFVKFHFKLEWTCKKYIINEEMNRNKKTIPYYEEMAGKKTQENYPTSAADEQMHDERVRERVKARELDIRK